MSVQPIYIIDGARSPFLKAGSVPGPFSAADLAVQTGQALLLRQPFQPSDLDEVIIGCAAPSPNETNIGRVIALRLGCGHQVPGWTVMRNCASGMQALDTALMSIQTGRSDLVLAGGVDALSRTPLLVSEPLLRWLAAWRSSSRWTKKLSTLKELRPGHLKPVISLLQGLTDPITGLSMGQTAENIAHQFGIARGDMDSYAAQSHLRALAARKAHAFAEEITPLTDAAGRLYPEDDGIREDSTLARLGKLKPAFDPPWGNITAGNSSQISDGAALLLLASQAAVDRWQLQPLGRIIDVQWSALDPAIMGLGPVLAATPILQRQQLGINDLDLWEINEAFAAQVLGCVAAWKDEAWCQENLGCSALGALDSTRLNVDGGAIALGHPVGASGARLVLHLVQALHARHMKRGMATLCIGGGQGGAMLIETCDQKVAS